MILSLVLEWISICSFADTFALCMYPTCGYILSSTSEAKQQKIKQLLEYGASLLSLQTI